MIPDVSVAVYGLVQLTIPVIAIHLELVGFHYGFGFLAFISYSVGCGRHRLAAARYSPTKAKRSIPFFTTITTLF